MVRLVAVVMVPAVIFVVLAIVPPGNVAARNPVGCVYVAMRLETVAFTLSTSNLPIDAGVVKSEPAVRSCHTAVATAAAVGAVAPTMASAAMMAKVEVTSGLVAQAATVATLVVPL